MKSSDSKTIVCIVCVILGVIIQFFVFPGIVTFVIGSLLIAIPPFFLAPQTVASPVSKSSGTPEKRWITVEKDDIGKTFAHAEESRRRFELYTSGDESIRNGCLSYVAIGIAVVLGVLFALSDIPRVGSFIIDLSIVPWAYIRLKYGNQYRQLFKEKRNATHGEENDGRIRLKKQNLETIYAGTESINPQMQFELGRVDEKAFFSDVRILYPTHDIPGLLCSMVSASINNYVYPYSYYVVVFKGYKIHNTPFWKGLEKIAKGRFYTNNTDLKDDTTILVVTKTSGYPEYATDVDDCELLSNIIIGINQYIEENKNEIIELTSES